MDGRDDQDRARRSATAASSVAAVGPDSARRTASNFDGLRLLAALLVVYGHQSVDQTGTMGLRLVTFFAIGGFLVTGSWTGDPHIGRFLARRFLRVWPAYATLIVVCAAVSWMFPAPDMRDVSRLASLFYLRNLVLPGFDWGFFPARNPFLNTSLWMLPFEVDMYLLFAVLALFGRRTRIVGAVVSLLIAMRAPQTVIATGSILECWSPYFGGFFAFGVLLRELPFLRRGAVVAACAASGIVLLWIGERSAGLLMLIPTCAVWIGQQAWPVLRSAARFGDLSYGIFLWSFPVQQVTRLWLAPTSPTSVQLAVVLLQVVPIAWLSCRFIEEPALRLKPPRPSARKQPQDAALARSLPSIDALLRFLRLGATSRGPRVIQVPTGAPVTSASPSNASTN